MFTINDDNSIYATRGDIVFFKVTADDDGKGYTFKAGDVVRMKIYGKKDAETVLMQKDFPVIENTAEVEIFLAEDDTKFGDVISKPTDYWYEVELNPGDNPQTIIGYDEDGAKVFKLFPEGDDFKGDEHIPTEEDIPFVDEALDLASPRPVANSAIAKELAEMSAKCDATFEAVAENFVTPQMYGAVGDGVADDTEAINDCLAKHKRVYLPEGTYKIDPNISLAVQDGQTLELSGNAVIKASVTDESKYNYAITIKDVSNVTVRGGKITGDRLEYPDSTAERGYGIFIFNSKNINIEDCEISDFRGDCIIMESYSHPYPTDSAEYESFVNSDIRISDCKIHNALRHGITVMGVRGLVVKDTEIYNTQGKSYSTAIDAEVHYEWQKMSDFRYENVRAYDCNNGVMFNQNAWTGTISGVSIERCDFDRTQLGVAGSVDVKWSDIRIISVGSLDSFVAAHCNIGQCYITHLAKKVTVNKCVFDCTEDFPEAFSFQYSTEASTVECEINDCVINSFASDVKDNLKNLFAIQCPPVKFTLNGCTLYVNNPNGVKLQATNLIKVFGCKLINKFEQDGYPSAILSVSAAENYIIGNVFDTTEASATNNDKCIIESSNGDMFFANNVGVMTEIFGVLLSFSAGATGRTWTMMNNVFPKYAGKGQTADGVTYVDVGNIYSGTT